jgi:hypothetical protein
MQTTNLLHDANHRIKTFCVRTYLWVADFEILTILRKCFTDLYSYKGLIERRMAGVGGGLERWGGGVGEKFGFLLGGI